MEEESAFNVEIGATSNCDPFILNTAWPWNLDWYGDLHLIRGLRSLKRIYGARKWQRLYDVADYGLFLGYAGLVLAESLSRIHVTEPLLAVWGFCDGDLFFLARRTPAGLERIAQVI
ncbi:MAG: hypothetical protein ACYC7A_20775 [Thermoanaerobaculia bacterium]